MAVLSGEHPDRPPYSFWHHFNHNQIRGREAVEAHVAHLSRYDLDFVKVMNDNSFPQPAGKVVAGVKDLGGLRELSGEEEPFLHQLELIKALRGRVGNDIFLATTIFSPWSTLRYLVAEEPVSHGPPKMRVGCDPRNQKISEFIKQDRQAVADALLIIAKTLRNFAAKCLAYGADGVFLSVRDDWVDTAENGLSTYDEIVGPADLTVCEGIASGCFNILHICGVAKNFDRFIQYPVQVLNWADRSAGPSIAEASGKVAAALCGGVDNLKTLSEGTAAECAAEVRDALVQAGTRPIIISPGCTYDPNVVPTHNLDAVCAAAREGVP